MATNQRIYYPIQAVGFAPLGIAHDSSGYTGAKGVQSVGHSANFNLEQVYQLGQLDLYENIEDIPDVEITIEKVIDGYALLEHLATPGASASSLAGRYNDQRCSMAIAYYPITNESATGLPLQTVVMSGVYVSAINWTIPVEGNITESISLVGNDRAWYGTGVLGPWAYDTGFTGNESPITASGGVQRRENVVMASSYWPTEVPGISGDGTNPSINGVYSAHIQNVSIATSLARTELFELGSKAPYFRYANFPTEVTCSIEITATETGDGIDASSTADNLVDQRIFIMLTQGVMLDLGTKNKLQSVNTDGGDTGGGNVTSTYNYSNFNTLKVLMPATDPAGLTS